MFSKLKKQLFLGIFLTGFSTVILAQDDVYSKGILPPSPEAASFAKNVNIPMSYTSGTPQISIPFASVKSGIMEVPVSISYNASGIRVEEVATWVGLGWNLNAGGQISRVVRGHPDETSGFGYMNVYNNRKVKYVDAAHCRCANLSSEGLAIEQELNTYHQLDLEPDQFTFSVLGYSGDFIYNQDSSKFLMMPYQNITIEGLPGSFVLTLPNGVKCYFGATQESREILNYGTTSSYVDGVSYAATEIPGTGYATTWMLTTIIDPSGKTIDFTYATEHILAFGRGTETFGQSTFNVSPQNRQQSFYKQQISKPVLRQISGESGNVYFKQSSSTRLDMPGSPFESKSLDTLLITGQNNQSLRSFYFEYGYFISSSNPAQGVLDINTYINEAGKRLYLKSITEKNGTVALPPHLFTYSDVELPGRLSTAQDNWGYYNGKSNGANMMPNIPGLGFNPLFPNFNEDQHILPTIGFKNVGGADRRIDTNFTQARILKKIQYPTGGVTEYYYEQNKVSTDFLTLYGGMVPPDKIDRSFLFSTITVPMPSAAPYPLSYSGTFTINIPVTQVNVVTQLATCTTYQDASCKITIRLTKVSDNSVVGTINTNGSFTYQLPQGQYLVEALINESPTVQTPPFQVNVQWGERTDAVNYIVGGVRAKKIINRDGAGNTLSRSFDYTYEGTSKSSGIIEGCPTYQVVNWYTSTPYTYRQYFTSNSVLPLTTDGKTLRYEFVTEYQDSAKTSFKTNYTFTSGLYTPTKFAAARTGVPLTSWSWQNNLLKRKEIFEKTGAASYRILSEEKNYFIFYQPLMDLYGLYGNVIIPYQIATEWHLPDSTATINYSYNGAQQNAIISTLKYSYNHRYLQAGSKMVNSKGQLINNKQWFPTDYNNVAGFNMTTLYNKHIWSNPIKQETSIDGKIMTGNIIKYNEFGFPVESYSYENATLSNTVVPDRNIVLEANYVLRTAIQYDINKDIKQINHYKNGPTTYIWDHQINSFTGVRMNVYPIAVIQDADSTSVAYSSFENASKGNWNASGSIIADATSPTGSYCYYLTGANISKAGLQSGTTYIISYWSKNGSYTLSGSPIAKQGRTSNGWTNYKHEVTGITSLTVSGNGYIDELRLFPKNAVITTYTQKPSIGITSQCDVNSRITYYEYDDLGRMNIVRDQDRNIIKKICYNYAGQQTSCSETLNLLAPLVYTCNTTNCTGANKKCINNICETATKYLISSVRQTSTTWLCTYKYIWSDFSESAQFTETSVGICPF